MFCIIRTYSRRSPLENLNGGNFLNLPQPHNPYKTLYFSQTLNPFFSSTRCLTMADCLPLEPTFKISENFGYFFGTFITNGIILYTTLKRKKLYMGTTTGEKKKSIFSSSSPNFGNFLQMKTICASQKCQIVQKSSSIS